MVLAAGALVFLVDLPRGLDPDTPLPCDQAQPLREALAVQSALTHLSLRRLADCLIAPDVYPPGHSLLLGFWLTLAGSGPISLQMFKLATLCGCLVAIWLCGRTVNARGRPSFLAGTTSAFLLTVPLIALSGTFLLEVPTIALALTAIAILAGWQRESRHALRAVVAGLTVGAAILTKYNVGLPLVPVALALGGGNLVAGCRRRGLGQIAAAGIGLSLLVLFLTLQVDGWRNGLAFAVNRANSEGASALARLTWYARLYVESFFPHPTLAAGALVLAGGAICMHVRRTPLVAAATLYVAATLAALALHPYLLDRNIVAASALTTLLVGVGLAICADLLRRRQRALRLTAAAMGLALALGAAWAARPAVLTARRPYDSPELSRLAALSRYVRGSFARVGSCRILGAFNEFGPGWTQILWHQAHPDVQREVGGDFLYPLASSRTGLDDRSDPAYAAQLAQWAAGDPEESILAITVREGSTWDSDDYRLWNRWKRNTVAAALALPGYATVDEFDVDEGAVHVYFLAHPSPPVSYDAGWGSAENWGRWALAREATLTLRPPAQPTNLVLVVAAFEGLPHPQECEIRIADGGPLRFEITGPPWQWQTIEIPLSSGPPGRSVPVSIRFGGIYAAFHGDSLLRALPFADVRLTPRLR